MGGNAKRIEFMIESESGRKLEGYKNTYLRQPKVIRIGFQILVSGLAVGVGLWPDSFGEYKLAVTLATVLLVMVAAYNQYLEAFTTERLQHDLRREVEQSNYWKKIASRYSVLNSAFSELVSLKSDMWIETMKIANSSGREDAVRSVRARNNLPANLERLVQTADFFFQRSLPNDIDPTIRVAYFSSKTDDVLELENWVNRQNIKPKTCRILRNEPSFATYVWTRQSNEPVIIDDVQTYMDNHQRDGAFRYFHDEQHSSIRSILCFRVEDHETRLCLGVVSVDSNVPGLFETTIGTSLCRSFAAAFSTRIVFETRFALMKSELGEY